MSVWGRVISNKRSRFVVSHNVGRIQGLVIGGRTERELAYKSLSSGEPRFKQCGDSYTTYTKNTLSDMVVEEDT
jgi:hypothetical protein